MGLFDRFKRRTPEAPPPEWPKAPRADTMCLLLMDRVLGDIQPAVELLRSTFGHDAVGNIDLSHPRVPALTVTVEGLELWCSYLPMPVPPQEQDIPKMARYDPFLAPAEREAFSGNKSFWVLAQKGGGTDLGQKRRACWALSRLCAALLELEGAVGVCAVNSSLLISRARYLFQRTQMEGRSWEDEEYFPVPLWIWLYPGQSEGKPTAETCGLREFGLPELGFFDPKLPLPDILNYLYTMACFQITGQQLYRNMARIPLTDEIEVVCKQEGEKLYFIGG